MKRHLFIALALTCSAFTMNQIVAEEAKKETEAADEKGKTTPTSEKEEKDEGLEKEEIALNVDNIAQQRVNDQFRSAQPSGEINSFRTGNQGPIRTDGYYYDPDDYYNDPYNNDGYPRRRRGN